MSSAAGGGTARRWSRACGQRRQPPTVGVDADADPPGSKHAGLDGAAAAVHAGEPAPVAVAGVLGWLGAQRDLRRARRGALHVARGLRSAAVRPSVARRRALVP